MCSDGKVDPAAVELFDRFVTGKVCTRTLGVEPGTDGAAICLHVGSGTIPGEQQELLQYEQMRKTRMIWRPAPGWPEAPPGWQPPPGWSPPPDWPPAPVDWDFWTAAPDEIGRADLHLQPGGPAQADVPAQAGLPTGMTRAGLVLETRLVMIAGLFPWIAAAVVILVRHLDTGQILTQLPSVTPHQPVLNVFLSVLSYVPSAAVVPLVLLLLIRTGQRPSDLGLTRLPWRDLGVAVGLAAAAIGLELALAIAINPVRHSRFVNTAATLDVPAYYLIIALSVALTTAVAEEVIVNGYLITRLDQLGWSPAKAFWLSMALRTSYHLYYGLGAVLTLPFWWLVTRSFQKHRKLNRPIVAHFLYDGTVATIAILIVGRR